MASSDIPGSGRIARSKELLVKALQEKCEFLNKAQVEVFAERLGGQALGRREDLVGLITIISGAKCYDLPPSECSEIGNAVWDEAD